MCVRVCVCVLSRGRVKAVQDTVTSLVRRQGIRHVLTKRGQTSLECATQCTPQPRQAALFHHSTSRSTKPRHEDSLSDEGKSGRRTCVSVELGCCWSDFDVGLGCWLNFDVGLGQSCRPDARSPKHYHLVFYPSGETSWAPNSHRCGFFFQFLWVVIRQHFFERAFDSLTMSRCQSENTRVRLSACCQEQYIKLIGCDTMSVLSVHHHFQN